MTVQNGHASHVYVSYGVDPVGLAYARQTEAEWLYLGKEVSPRAKVATALGRKRHRRLGTELHRAAEKLRGPFLDFVAEVGAQQTDSIRWWSTAFSWKNWGASDLFLLICYLKLAEDTVREAVRTETPLLIQIEDPWLFEQLRKNLSGESGFRFSAAPGLLRRKMRAVMSGLTRRIAWLPDVCLRYWRQKRIWPNKTEEPTKTPGVGIYSFPMGRCLRPNREWHDPFLPGMDAFLRAEGFEVFRFSPPESGGFERELADRSSYFRPLILYATLASILRSWFAFWSPIWPEALTVDKTPVGTLVLREWWTELALTALCANQLYYECLASMLKEIPCIWLVYPYENQPWEKLTVMAAGNAGFRTVGVQHAAWSKFYMSLFQGQSDAAHMPLPDFILTSGEYSQNLLSGNGISPKRLRMCGSFRYDHLVNSDPGSSGERLQPALRTEVLVVLPIDDPMSDHLLLAIRDSVQGTEGLRFHIKAHPSRQVDVNRIGFPAVAAPGDIVDAFEQCGTVLFVGSTVGPEAVAMGRAVLRYQPELLLDVDPSEAYGDSIPSCDDSNLLENLMELIEAVDTPQTQPAFSTFAPLDRELLAEVFSTPSQVQ